MKIMKKHEPFQKNLSNNIKNSPHEDFYSICEKSSFVTRRQRSKHVLVVFSGIISFCVCYYHGPVTSDRGLDLIRWMLQLVGLTLLYMGTRSDVVSFGVISTVFLSHVIRSSGILMGVIKVMPRNW